MTPEEQKRIVDDVIKSSPFAPRDLTAEEKLADKVNDIERQVWFSVTMPTLQHKGFFEPEKDLGPIANAYHQLLESSLTKEELLKALSSYMAGMAMDRAWKNWNP